MTFYVQPDGMSPVRGYSHAVSFSGPLVAVSGQLPLDTDGHLVGTGDAEAQVRQVFRNVSAALSAAGSGLDRLVKITVFLTDLADLDVFRRVRDEFIDADQPPASSLVRVAGLVYPDARVEVEAWATI